jgi:hypothetical protein
MIMFQNLYADDQGIQREALHNHGQDTKKDPSFKGLDCYYSLKTGDKLSLLYLFVI